jgi:signal transduction histidine kinase
MSSLFLPRGSDGVVALGPAPVSTAGRGIVSARRPLAALATATVPVGASAIWLAATSDHLEHPVATALYRCYLAVAPMLVGLYWCRRRPASRFGPLLIAFGVVAWAISWQSSDWPLAFDLGVLAEGPLTFLTFYLFIAFPSGRLETTADRLLMAAWAVVLLCFFLPWALGSPVIAGGGPLSGCVPACPENVLQVGSAPRLVETLGRWETYTGIVVTIATLAIYVSHLRAASHPRRRALIAVASSSLLFLPIFFAYHVSAQILKVDPGTLETMSWFVVGARVLLPVGFLLALLQAELFAGVARGRLLEQLMAGPSPEQWRDDVARALDDPELRLGYWDIDARRYRDADGSALAPPGADAGRAWVEVDRDGRPVAAMVIDGALAEDPELVRAAASATTLAVEHGNLEGELRHSRARIVAAGDAERRRIERDLHDGAQQRLVALRLHLAIASEQLDGHEQQVLVDRLGTQVEEALEDLRTIASGVYPKILTDAGVAAALRSASRHAALSLTIDDGWRRRHPEEIEAAVYFSCLEALQNAAKHGGPDARARVRLGEENGCVGFTVEDDGRGFDPRSVERGAGLNNIAERVSAAGGTLRIDAAPGRGTRVSGRIPAG